MSQDILHRKARCQEARRLGLTMPSSHSLGSQDPGHFDYWHLNLGCTVEGRKVMALGPAEEWTWPKPPEWGVQQDGERAAKARSLGEMGVSA